jgi:hypothetical protein
MCSAKLNITRGKQLTEHIHDIHSCWNPPLIEDFEPNIRLLRWRMLINPENRSTQSSTQIAPADERMDDY